MNLRKISSLFFAGILCLSPIGVKAAQMYAENEAGTKVYTSIDDAWNAAQNGTKIIMNCDWDLSERLVLDSGKSATIEMNGHKIYRNLNDSKTNGEVIKLCSNSTLNLNGTKVSNTNFTINGYNEENEQESVTITSGGLITGGNSTNGGGGIHMKEGSTLNLDSVAISGNSSVQSWKTDGKGGGICMDGDGDKVKLTNAQISYNRCDIDGGGIHIDDKKSNVEMSNSQIVHNYSARNGGGISSAEDDTTISLDNSSINYNAGYDGGGGIYFRYSKFKVSSENKNSEISYNKSNSYYGSGGGIYIAQSAFEENYGTIYGIKFNHNSCNDHGGAIAVYQDNITVSDCTLTENEAETDGAIRINNDGFILENSTVQNNTTREEDSGAVYVDSAYDIQLKGKVIITNNQNTSYNASSNLYLQTGFFTDSYIVSAPDSTSSIGLRIDGARTYAKNQNESTRNVFSTDNGFDYYLDYENGSIIAKENSSDRTVIANAFDNDELMKEEAEKNYTVTLNLVNEAGTWQSTKKTEIAANHLLDLQAPEIEDKTFVEFKDVPEGMSVEEDTIKTDAVTEDMVITVIYSDADSESTETGSIFGDGNTTTIAVVLVGIVVIGIVAFFVKKKKSS